MIKAAIYLDFDPLLWLGELSVRWQTIGVALAILVGVALSSRRCGALRLEDIAYLLPAAAPGAVVGGRLVHALVFWETYAADPLRLVDPTVGSLSLLGAVLGGTLGAAYMARVLRLPIGRLADAAAGPLLVTLGLGKFAQVLGGGGQGAPFDGAWAVAFVGDGPWISALPAMPSHPAQVYEGAWLLVGALVIFALPYALRGPTERTGSMYVAALAIFLLGRLIVGFTWRDDSLIGPLNAEQVLALAALLIVGMAAVFLVRPDGSRRRPSRVGAD